MMRSYRKKMNRILSVLLVVVLMLTSVNSSFLVKANETDDSSIVILDDEKSVSGGSTATINTDAAYIKEGSKSYNCTTKSGMTRLFIENTSLGNIDISSVTGAETTKNGALRFWIYVDSAADAAGWNYTDGSKPLVRLGSGSSSNYYIWQGWNTQITEDGWNEIILSFDSVYSTIGTPDITKINYIYINKMSTDIATVYIDHVRVTASTQKTSGRVQILDDERSVSGGSNATINTDGAYIKEGTNSYKCTTKSGLTRLLIQNTTLSNVNLTGYAVSGALRFWIYVEDASVVTNWTHSTDGSPMVWLGSDSTENYYYWSGWQLQVEKDGWNQIVLPFSAATVKGEPNIEAIKYIDIKKMNTDDAGMTVYIDDVHVTAQSGLVLPSFFGDHMVFQQGKAMKLWGTGDSEETVCATLYSNDEEVETVRTTVDTNGEWELSLSEREAGYTSYNITITCGGQQTNLEDVMVGEVWLASGQSNMELKVSQDMDVDTIIANATNEYVRFFWQPTLPQGETVDKGTPYSDIPGGYWACGDDAVNVKRISSLGYNFAYSLQAKLQVPVAVIDATVGATSIEAWLSREAIDAHTELKSALQENGLYRDLNTTVTGRDSMSLCYNQKIGPLEGISIAGVIWYQGEGNYKRSELYDEEIALLKHSWGEIFGFSEGDMPFIFTQLAPYQYNAANSTGLEAAYMAMYMEQGWKALDYETTAMLTLYDLPLEHMKNGETTHAIHPRTKTVVGQRFAQTAFNMVYEGVKEYTAPVFRSFKVNGDYIEITFSHVGDGLKTTDASSDVHGFTIAGADGVYVNAKAEIVDTDTVRVWNERVNIPQNVMYAFSNFNQGANLCNSEGIPASPFRTVQVEDTLSNPDESIVYFKAQDWMYADKDVWVYDSTFSEEDYHGYRPSWTVSDGATYSYDTDNHAEGTASLKVEYSDDFSLTPVLTYESVKQSWENYDYLSVKVKNSLSPITLSMQVESDGTHEIPVVDDENAVIQAGDDFQQVTFDMTGLTAEQKKNLTSVSFKIDVAEAGIVYFDDFSFGLTDTATVKCVKYQNGEEITGGIAPVDIETGYVFGGWYDDYNKSTKKFSNPLSKGQTKTASSEDSIYAKLVPAGVLGVKAQTRKLENRVTLTNCDEGDDNNIKTLENASYTTEKTKEGTGALKGDTTKQTFVIATMTSGIDVTGYKKLCFWMYIDDQVVFANDSITIELTSSGANDKQQKEWTYQTDSLEVGAWNKVELLFAKATTTSNDIANSNVYNGKAVNHIRMFASAAPGGTILIDDIYATNEELQGKVIADCDSSTTSGWITVQDNSAALVAVDTASERKEGSGVYSKTRSIANNGQYQYLQLKLSSSNAIDISKYQNGSLHLWLYIDDVDKLSSEDAIMITVSSDQSISNNRETWYIKKAGGIHTGTTYYSAPLQSGWNEILLPFQDGFSGTGGDMNYASLNYFAIAAKGATTTATDVTLMVDDIRVVDTVQLFDFDTEPTAKTYQRVSEGVRTTTSGQVKAGVGADMLKNSTAIERHTAVLANGIDISNYAGNTAARKGSLHFWFYISNLKAWQDDMVVYMSNEVNSAGDDISGTNYVRWTLSKEYLVDGWNEIYLDLSQNATGTVDYTAIRAFKIMQGGDSTGTARLTTILDDVSVVGADVQMADVRFVSTVDSLEYNFVGLKIEKSGSSIAVDTPSTCVYKRLYGVNTNGSVLDYTPTDIHGTSKYFFASTITGMPNRLFNDVLTVTAYWETPDGTKVYGEPRCFTMNQIINGTINGM